MQISKGSSIVVGRRAGREEEEESNILRLTASRFVAPGEELITSYFDSLDNEELQFSGGATLRVATFFGATL